MKLKAAWAKLLSSFGFKRPEPALFVPEHEIALQYGFYQIGQRGETWVVRCLDSCRNHPIDLEFKTYEEARRVYFDAARKQAAFEGSNEVPSPTSCDPEIHF